MRKHERTRTQRSTRRAIERMERKQSRQSSPPRQERTHNALDEHECLHALMDLVDHGAPFSTHRVQELHDKHGELVAIALVNDEEVLIVDADDVMPIDWPYEFEPDDHEHDHAHDESGVVH